MTSAQFHLAFPVRDLEEARAFYLETIGCRPGRETHNHIDFDMFGHHVVAHLVPSGPAAAPSEFDGHEVPVPHFGLNLARAEWEHLAERLKRSRCRFREYPHARLVGQVGEHDTLFVYDPSGNALEFKSFRDPSQVFTIDPAHAAAAPAPDSEQVLRPRVEAAIHRTRGAVQESLLASGFLDSIAAMELVTALQDDLGVALAELLLTELATVTTLVAAVAAAVRAQAGRRAAHEPARAAGAASP
ncbi:MAG TPA: VOC family protein [Kofleriaceae bacterium]|nr:VOC family protein [Kofleriaceae bacterium]